jgi:hypothetical protein
MCDSAPTTVPEAINENARNTTRARDSSLSRSVRSRLKIVRRDILGLSPMGIGLIRAEAALS